MPTAGDASIARARKSIEGARKTLVQQQTETEPADPAALAEMQVKNLDKFAKKLKKQYKDAMSQNTSSLIEITFINAKLKELNAKNNAIILNLEMREGEYERMTGKLEECKKIEDALMFDVKSRVLTNNRILSKNQKTNARDTKAAAMGFSVVDGTTCSVDEGKFRARRIKEIKVERGKVIDTMRSTMGVGSTMGAARGMALSESMKSLSSMKYDGAGRTMRGSESTSAIR